MRIHADFLSDLNSQLSWLATKGDPGHIDHLEMGIEEAIALLSQFPGVGTLEASDGKPQLRRLILRRLPYVVWFQSGSSKDVWLLRLFHARQDRPRLTMDELFKRIQRRTRVKPSKIAVVDMIRAGRAKRGK